MNALIPVNHTFYKQLAYEQYLKCFESSTVDTSNHINHVYHHHIKKSLLNVANNLYYEPLHQGA